MSFIYSSFKHTLTPILLWFNLSLSSSWSPWWPPLSSIPSINLHTLSCLPSLTPFLINHFWYLARSNELEASPKFIFQSLDLSLPLSLALWLLLWSNVAASLFRARLPLSNPPTWNLSAVRMYPECLYTHLGASEIASTSYDSAINLRQGPRLPREGRTILIFGVSFMRFLVCWLWCLDVRLTPVSWSVTSRRLPGFV